MTYISGFIVPVPTANKDAYHKVASEAGALFLEFGALEVMEAWGDNTPDGEVTDFRRAVQAKDVETVVFSWIIWPDKATADEAEQKMMSDERMGKPDQMPFEGKRMVFGSFVPLYQTRA